MENNNFNENYNAQSVGGGQAPQNQGKQPVKQWVAILLLILFWPVGLVLTWKTSWKKGVKIGITVFFAVVLLAAIFGGSSSDSGSSSGQTQGQSNSSQSETQNNSQSARDYQTVSIRDMLDALESNALKAEDTYMDKYIQFTGYLDQIDSSGSYVTVKAMDADEWDFMASIECGIETEEQKNAVMEMNSGDKVTVKGKVTMVGDILGYYVEMDSITVASSSSNTSNTQKNESSNTKTETSSNSNETYEHVATYEDVANYDNQINNDSQDSSNVSETPEVVQSTKSYNKADIGAMFELLNQNAARASSEYVDKYIEITGTLDYIDTNMGYGSIQIKDPNADEWDLTSQIYCDITSQDQLDAIMNYNKGDQITVRGKVTMALDGLAYYMDIDEIVG